MPRALQKSGPDTDARMDEFQLIRRYFEGLTPLPPGVRLGIGDDAALLAVPAGEELAITSDTLVAGRHFPLDTAAADIGWKALAVNLSDLAAMGAVPYAFTLALTLPQVEAGWLRDFTVGLSELARASGIALVGGDTTRGPLSLTITALGRVPAGQGLRRSGARPGDLVCITGTLGDAALALRLRGVACDPALRRRLDRPEPRIAAGLALRGLATAALDLSDGLAGDLPHILEASGVGADIGIDLLPASAAFDQAAPASLRQTLQLSGGDDYELCVCLPESRYAEACAALAGLPLTAIGRIGAQSGLRWRDAAGDIIPLEASGYRHFP